MISIKNVFRCILIGLITMLYCGCKKYDPVIQQDDKPKLKKESFFGNLTDTIPLFYNLYEYDDRGNLIKKTGYSGTPEDYVTYYITYEYDAENKLIKESQYAGEYIELWAYSIYTYSGSHLIKQEDFSANNEFIMSYNYEYDNRGNMIKSWHFSPDQGVHQVTYFEYDENNNLVKEIGSSAFWIYEYDEDNRKISMKSYSLPDTTLLVHYAYEYSGNLLIRHNYINIQTEEIEFITEYFYDSNDHLIEVIDEKDGIRKTFQKFIYENNLKVVSITYDRWHNYDLNAVVRYEYY